VISVGTAVVSGARRLDEMLVLVEPEIRHFDGVAETSHALRSVPAAPAPIVNLRSSSERSPRVPRTARALAAIVDWLIAETVGGT
jgi:hypothetical protein